MHRIANVLLVPAIVGGLAWTSRTPFRSSHDHAPRAQAGMAAPAAAAEDEADPELALDTDLSDTESALRARLSVVPEAMRQSRAGNPIPLRDLDAAVRGLARRDEALFVAAIHETLPSIENLPPSTSAYLVRAIVHFTIDPTPLLGRLLARTGSYRLNLVQLYAIDEIGRRIETDSLIVPDTAFVRVLARADRDLRVVRESQKLLRRLSAAPSVAPGRQVARAD